MVRGKGVREEGGVVSEIEEEKKTIGERERVKSYLN